MRRGTHFAPEDEREVKRKERRATKIAYAIAIVIVLSIAIFAGIKAIQSFNRLLSATPDEAIPTEPMTMGVLLWTDGDWKDITPTAKPTTSPTNTPTFTPTETNSITPTENDKVEPTDDVIKYSDPTEPPTEQIQEATKPSYTFLMEIDNPDFTYEPMVIHLNDEDRELAAKIIMREFGDGGYTACCLQAQALRDDMIYSRSSLEQIYHFFQYDTYPLNRTPNKNCYKAIDYIFESGGLAVPHRILVMYSPQYASSPWHESQIFVVEYRGVRFFDMR